MIDPLSVQPMEKRHFMKQKTLQEYLATFREHSKKYEAMREEETGSVDDFNLPLAFVAILEAILKLQGWSDP